MFLSRYPSEKVPPFETFSDGWMNQVFLRKLLYNKGYMISIEHVYTEICKNCDFPVPSFDIVNRIVLKYKSTNIKFSNFIINCPENKLIDKYTFKKNNIDVSIPKRGESNSPKNNNDNISVKQIINIPPNNMNMNMKVVYYFKVYAELLYTISRYRTKKYYTW